jgi:biopolymer transport protein ExbB/TolQ
MALMFLWMMLNTIGHVVQYGDFGWQSRSFLKTSLPLLGQGKWEDVLALAQIYSRSHVACVFSTALREFRTAREIVSLRSAVKVADRGACVAANGMSEKLRTGVTGLKAIALTAQFVGLFGTAIKLLDWFGGYVGDKHTGVLLIFSITAEALVPTAVGLFVSIVAVWWFNWRSARVERLDAEMRVASLGLLKHLKQQSVRQHTVMASLFDKFSSAKS